MHALPADRSPIVTTYSIVARDPATGQLGLGVQSCYFGVGAAVPWAEAGVGAVATQSFTNMDFGPRGLALMRQGVPPAEALAQLLGDDPQREMRQVALVDAQGRVAAHTGDRCAQAAGHQLGEGVSVQANLMTDSGVWPAMLTAFEGADGDLAQRLLTALEAAEAAGGDIRGRQSAALLVVSAERTDQPWQGRLIDVRVDDHPQPLAELGRLLQLRRAYQAFERFTTAAGEGRLGDALPALAEAQQLAPQQDEFRLSGAIMMYMMGRRDEANGIWREIFGRKPQLAEFVQRMAAVGVIPADPDLLQAIRDAAG